MLILRLLALGCSAAVILGCGSDAPSGPTGNSSPTAAAATGAPSSAAVSPTSGSPTPTATSPAPPPPPPQLAFRLIADGLERPTFLAHAGDGSGRLFVAEKQGRVLVIAGGRVQAVPFLDISDIVQSRANEQGLLGLAFHPGFAGNGRLFVTYTSLEGEVVLAEYRAASASGAVADPRSGTVLLTIPHPRSNHNGGMIAFGPDGYLYFGTGDGGGAGDPDRTGQDLGTLAGKLLRLDVGGSPGRYSIPTDNPFRARDDARPEIWAYGLRNPWRFSFDRATGDLWIGDVGQNAVEEVNFQPSTSPGGENYGWSVKEGEVCYRPSSGCSSDGLVDPIHSYTHASGCSITGGYVYRGASIPGLRGHSLYTDYCRTDVVALRLAPGGTVAGTVGRAPASITSFGEGEDGELYVLSDTGTISVIEAAAR